MIGNNEIKINQATMIEAIQEYFDKRYTSKIKITKVTGSTINNYSETFSIEVEGVLNNG